jgi:hypothetical protein
MLKIKNTLEKSNVVDEWLVLSVALVFRTHMNIFLTRYIFLSGNMLIYTL